MLFIGTLLNFPLNLTAVDKQWGDCGWVVGWFVALFRCSTCKQLFIRFTWDVLRF